MRPATLRVLWPLPLRACTARLREQSLHAGSRCWINAGAACRFINGSVVHSAAVEDVPVTDPATQLVLARTPLATTAEMEAAVAAAKNALPAWSATPAPNPRA